MELKYSFIRGITGVLLISLRVIHWLLASQTSKSVTQASLAVWDATQYTCRAGARTQD